MHYTTYLLASTYGGGTYDSSTYQSGTITSGTSNGASTNSSAGGILTNTGFDLLLAATIAASLALAAIVIRFYKRPNKKTGSA